MGSFMGHVLPGMLFFIAGIWFSIKYTYRHLARSHKKKSRSRFNCNVDVIEGCIKIAFPAIGILMEQVTNNGPEFHLTNTKNQYWDGNNWSHCTMYFFFIFAGIADILLVKCPKSTPKGINHLAMALALLIEGYLFYFHTHGREGLDVRIHVLLLLAIWTGAISLLVLCVLEALSAKDGKNSTATIVSKKDNEYLQLLDQEVDVETTPLDDTGISGEETQINLDPHINTPEQHKLSHEMLTLMNYMNQKVDEALKSQQYDCSNLKIILQMIFTISILLQGTWFFQIATILYPPGRDGWNIILEVNVEFATIFFAWHLVGIITYVSAVYVSLCLLMSRKKHNVEL